MRRFKYFLSFESFTGELQYASDHPEKSRLRIDIDASSVVCRDSSLRASKQQRLAEYVRDLALNAAAHPSIQFSSYQISTKALRGLIVEGALTLCGTTKAVKMNAVFSERNANRLDIEADSLLKLSEFGIRAPSSLFGLMETQDQVLVHLQMSAARKI